MKSTSSKKGRRVKVAKAATAAPPPPFTAPFNNQRRLVWPHELEERYNISAPTRWRWESTGKLPKRDVHVGGRPVGWRPETLDAAERGPGAPS